MHGHAFWSRSHTYLLLQERSSWPQKWNRETASHLPTPTNHWWLPSLSLANSGSVVAQFSNWKSNKLSSSTHGSQCTLLNTNNSVTNNNCDELICARGIIANVSSLIRLSCWPPFLFYMHVCYIVRTITRRWVTWQWHDIAIGEEQRKLIHVCWPRQNVKIIFHMKIKGWIKKYINK